MTEATPVIFPERDWGDAEPAPEPVPYVLVSSHDGQGDPVAVSNRSAAWRSVRKAAELAGWTVATTYALAWTADRYYLNGKIAKSAHHVHSVALRMTRGAQRAVAVWWAETIMPDVPVKGWTFDMGRVRGVLGPSLGLNGFREALI